MGEKLLKNFKDIDVRGLNSEYIEFIKHSDEAEGLREIFKSIREGNEEELFVGVRNNYISIYFKCMCVFKKISFVNKNGKVSFGTVATDHNYLTYTNKQSADKTMICLEGVRIIKKGIIEHYKSNFIKEKDYQQRIVLANNSDSSSKWYCFDVENNKGDNGYGRYDIIAISKTPNLAGKYSIALIELKVRFKYKTGRCNNPYGNKSGILGHFVDWKNYLEDVEFKASSGLTRVEITKFDAINILKTYNEFGVLDEEMSSFIKDVECEKIEDIPQMIFLTYNIGDVKLSSTKDSFRNYVFSGYKDSSEIAIANVLDGSIIKDYKEKNIIKCVFKDGLPEYEVNRAIFRDVEISEAKNIFDEEAYK